MRYEKPMNEGLEFALTADTRCEFQIELHGKRYRCMRVCRHMGIHDAGQRSAKDGGLVRW